MRWRRAMVLFAGMLLEKTAWLIGGVVAGAGVGALVASVALGMFGLGVGLLTEEEWNIAVLGAIFRAAVGAAGGGLAGALHAMGFFPSQEPRPAGLLAAGAGGGGRRRGRGGRIRVRSQSRHERVDHALGGDRRARGGRGRWGGGSRGPRAVAEGPSGCRSGPARGPRRTPGGMRPILPRRVGPPAVRPGARQADATMAGASATRDRPGRIRIRDRGPWTSRGGSGSLEASAPPFSSTHWEASCADEP